MSHYFNHGHRTPAMDAAYLNPPGSGDRQMAKRSTREARALPASGIFGPEWYKWRGATLRVEPDEEPPFTARLEAVEKGVAHLTVLDALGRPNGVQHVPWPPQGGSVRVVRAP